jgi:hypothetical protein
MSSSLLQEQLIPAAIIHIKFLSENQLISPPYLKDTFLSKIEILQIPLSEVQDT